MIQQQNYGIAVAITTSNTINFDGTTFVAGAKARPCEAIFVGGAGIVVAVMQDGSTVNFTCVAGEILPIKAIRVNVTNTTASLMVELRVG